MGGGTVLLLFVGVMGALYLGRSMATAGSYRQHFDLGGFLGAVAIVVALAALIASAVFGGHIWVSMYDWWARLVGGGN